MADQAVPPAVAEESAPEGDVTEALKGLESGLTSVASADLPPEAKAAFEAALEAFRAGVEVLSGGGGARGPVAMEAGASGARPVSHGGPR
jgi:hypothetical protein